MVSVALWIAFAVASLDKIGGLVDSVVAIFYFTLTIGGPHGQTPGMRLTGIAVIDEATGTTISYPKAFLRFLLVSLFTSLFAIPLLLVWLWALYEPKRRALHDKAVGTVVIEVSDQPAMPATSRTIATSPGHSATASSPSLAPVQRRSPVVPIIGWIKARTARFWITTAAVLTATITIAVAVTITYSFVASQHSPARAATAYLNALSRKDASTILANAGIVTPAVTSPGTQMLLSGHDIARELSAPGNGPGAISHLTVVSTHTDANVAAVTLDYVADNGQHRVTFDLIRSSQTPSGWVVQITPSRLDVDIPQGETQVSIAGIPVRTTGTLAHFYLFPSVVTVATPATAIFDAASQTIDTTHQSPNSDPQEASLAVQLTAAAQLGAVNAVVNQINACLASTSLTPANCPNTDTPATQYQGDTYSGISWTGLGQPTAGFTATVNKGGQVTVSGAFTAEVTYTDTTPGSSFFGSVSDQETDGPTSWNFTYPLSWNGTGWILGTVDAQTVNN